MIFSAIWEQIKFWRMADRLGPDIPHSHWRLYLKPSMHALCRKKFNEFGEGAEFRPGAYAICCSKIRLGRRVIIRPGTMLFADPRDGGAGITIEDDVMLGSGVHIYVHNHSFEDSNLPIIDQGHLPSAPVILKRGSWVGANAIILAGVTIGANSVVGAGSVVMKSIPDKVLVSGNPAKVIQRLD